MNTEYLLQLWQVGLPLWILCIGAMIILLIDALFQKINLVLNYLGGLTLLVALIISMNRWVDGTFYTEGILIFDSFSLFLFFICSIVGIISLLNIYSYSELMKSTDPKRSFGLIPDSLNGAMIALVLLSIVGMVILFSSSHLILSFIGLEIMSMAIYVLVGSKRRDVRSNESALKYFVLGSAGSAIIIYGIAFIYGAYGTFNLAEIKFLANAPTYLPQIGLALILVGILFKLSLVPFHFWTPDVYEGAPTPITGFMASGVKVASFGFFIRLLMNISLLSQEAVVEFLFFAIIVTLVVGNLGAILQENIKRMLAYSSIAHAGFLLMGLFVGLSGQGESQGFDPQVSSSVFFYLFAYAITSLGAFAFLSLMVHGDEEAVYVSDLNGLASRHPYLAFGFTLFLLSLMGLPPTLGFMGKYTVLGAVVDNGFINLAIFAMIMSVVAAYYYLRPVVSMYFKPSSEVAPTYQIPLPLIFSLIFCALAVLLIGLMPNDYLNMANLAISGLK